MAVQLNGAEPLLYRVMKCSMLAINSMMLEKLPRRMARCVMIPSQRSTWLIQECRWG